MSLFDKFKRLKPARVRQALSSNPMARKYYSSAELRKMGFASVGDNVRIERSCVIVNPGYISIGHDVIIDQFTFVIAGEAGVEIGSWIHIAGHNLLGGNAGLVMEDFTNIAAGSKLISSSDDFGGDYLIGPSSPSKFTKIHAAPIILRENTILGAGTVVLPGCECAEGTATGANAVIVKSTEPWGIYVGSPAKRLKDRKSRCKELADQTRREFDGLA